ncbi:MAG: hypothetical protein V7637_1039 [Mycobacteriales bacterium]
MPTLRVSLLGTPFALDCADPGLATGLARLLASFRTAAGAADPGAGGAPAPGAAVRIAVAPDTDIGGVLAALNAAALARADYFAVHAGVVAAGGRAVAFPGPSGIGKTTLTVACLLAGLDYGSDEALCLDWSTGAVRPYPRPLALTPSAAELAGTYLTGTRPPGAGPPGIGPPGTGPPGADQPGAVRTADEIVLAVADLGAEVAAEPLALAHVLLPRRTGGSAALLPAPRGAAVAELLRRSFTAHHRPGQAFDLAHRVVAAAGTWYLDLGHPRDAAALVAGLINRPG